MLSANLVSWRMLLVLIVWICAVLVKSWGADGFPFASKPLSSIDGARAFNSFFGVSPYARDDSIYSPPSELEEQDILDASDSTQKGSEPDVESQPKSASSTSQTHSFLLRNAPALLKLPRNILDRFTSRRWSQQDTRDSAGILPSHISSPPYPPAHASKPHAQFQHIQVQDDSAVTLLSEVEIDSKQEEPSIKDGLLDDTSLSSAVFSSNDIAGANSTTDSSPRRFQNPLSMYDLSSGRSKAQGSCFGLVVGMIVAIVWL